MATKLNSDERDRAAQIIALFSCLVHEWFIGNTREAEETSSKLIELGVQVKLRPGRVAGGRQS